MFCSIQNEPSYKEQWETYEAWKYQVIDWFMYGDAAKPTVFNIPWYKRVIRKNTLKIKHYLQRHGYCHTPPSATTTTLYYAGLLKREVCPNEPEPIFIWSTPPYLKRYGFWQMRWNVVMKDILRAKKEGREPQWPSIRAEFRESFSHRS